MVMRQRTNHRASLGSFLRKSFQSQPYSHCPRCDVHISSCGRLLITMLFEKERWRLNCSFQAVCLKGVKFRHIQMHLFLVEKLHAVKNITHTNFVFSTSSILIKYKANEKQVAHPANHTIARSTPLPFSINRCVRSD